MSKLWVFGDSWTYTDVTNSWGKRIADDLGFEYINLAGVGLSNERILFNLLDTLPKIQRGDIVFLQTSYNSRFNYHNNPSFPPSGNTTNYNHNGFWYSSLWEQTMRECGIWDNLDIISDYHNKTINPLTSAYFQKLGVLLSSMGCIPIHIPIEKWVGYYSNWIPLGWNGYDNFEQIINDVMKDDDEIGDSHIKLTGHSVIYERLLPQFKKIVNNYQ